MHTYYLIGEIPVDGGEMMLPVEQVVCADTRADARRALQREYPGIDIVEMHLLDDD